MSLAWMTHWVWLGLAALLAAAETLVPGVYMIWLAAAALVTGGLAWALGLGWAAQLLAFAVLSIIAVLLGRAILKRQPPASESPGLNRRAAAMVGMEFILGEPIVDGRAHVRVGDSSWVVRGPDLPAGTRVRVAQVDGNYLVVEPLAG